MSLVIFVFMLVLALIFGPALTFHWWLVFAGIGLFLLMLSVAGED
jgi:hypothetical protein